MQNKKKSFNLKKLWEKFWFLFWKDESLKGFLFAIVILLIFVKLIFLPMASLISGTELPLAIVESCSMHHKGGFLFTNFDNWWENHNSKYSNYMINKLDFQEFPFRNGFTKGDILLIWGADPEKLKIGDIIIFEAGQKNPVIHRIIDITQNPNSEELIFSTIGDNNPSQLSIEKQITEDQIMGRAIFKIAPYAGWGKLIFFEPFRPNYERGFCEEN
ncbi:signal peptidase I [Candidatus Pacearchaeota archaeon]|nr:signal peptidase I [Candidatus Pacearchaeota archaeon]